MTGACARRLVVVGSLAFALLGVTSPVALSLAQDKPDVGALSRKAYALTVCANLAHDADAVGEWALFEAATDASTQFAEASVASGSHQAPRTLADEYKVGFEIGRVQEMWRSEIASILGAKLGKPYPGSLNPGDDAKREQWRKEMAVLAMDEFELRNCSLLLPAQ